MPINNEKINNDSLVDRSKANNQIDKDDASKKLKNKAWLKTGENSNAENIDDTQKTVFNNHVEEKLGNTPVEKTAKIFDIGTIASLKIDAEKIKVIRQKILEIKQLKNASYHTSLKIHDEKNDEKNDEKKQGTIISEEISIKNKFYEIWSLGAETKFPIGKSRSIFFENGELYKTPNSELSKSSSNIKSSSDESEKLDSKELDYEDIKKPSTMKSKKYDEKNKFSEKWFLGADTKFPIRKSKSTFFENDKFYKTLNSELPKSSSNIKSSFDEGRKLESKELDYENIKRPSTMKSKKHDERWIKGRWIREK